MPAFGSGRVAWMQFQRPAYIAPACKDSLLLMLNRHQLIWRLLLQAQLSYRSGG